MAIVEELIRGVDGLVRVVKVRSSTGTFLRPIQKVYPLESGVGNSSSPSSKHPEDDLVHDEVSLQESHVDSDVPIANPNNIDVDKRTVTRTGRVVKVPSRLDL